MLRTLLGITFVLIGAFNVSYSFNLTEYKSLILKLSADPKYVADFAENIKYLLEIEPNYFDYTPFGNKNFTFDCDTTTTYESSESVHALRPQDIKVVAAMGDSLTAALGGNAKTIFGLLIEYRGRSWSIGGNLDLEKLFTLPNLMKKFNPSLTGFTTQSDFAPANEDGVGLNAAVSGQEANHILNQAKTLVARLKSRSDIDYKNDWKLITLFIGGNDLCRFCKDMSKHSPNAYVSDIQVGLDYLYSEVPRAFVNLVSVLNISHVKDLNKGLVCNVLHQFECKCSAFPTGNQEEELQLFLDQYQNFTQELVDTGRYDGRDDFTVVVQPFFKSFTTPKLPNGKLDFSYLAPDCFHFSTKGHAAAAMGLWNNMLQPVGQKSNAWTPSDKLLCPTKDRPYFFTKKNSAN